MPTAANQSRGCTRLGLRRARNPKTNKSSVAITGWTSVRLLTRRAATWKPKPAIMHRRPTNQTGRWSRKRIRRQLKAISPGAGAAAKRCATEAVAVNALATSARSRPPDTTYLALSISAIDDLRPEPERRTSPTVEKSHTPG